MPRINTIALHVQTGNLSGAGTDGSVYLGVCGREFLIDTSHDDFERGSVRDYVLGEGSNINNAAVNDPREQLLLVENVDDFPVYLRFQPRPGSDHWQLQRATVWFNGDILTQWDTYFYVSDHPTRGIWLGIRSGLFVHIPRNRGSDVK